MLRLRFLGFFFAINLNLNFLYANTSLSSPLAPIDSFPEVFLDSIHIRVNKHWDINLSPISNVFLFNPIDGFLCQTGIKSRFNANKPVTFSLHPRYAIQRKILYAEAEVSAFLVNEKINSSQLFFSAGNFLTQVNQPFIKNEQIISIINVLDGVNPLLFIEKKFFKVQFNQTLFSNFIFQASSEFADRTYLENYTFQRWNFSRNEPLESFKLRDKALIHTFSLSYFPFLTINFKKGTPGFLESESNFEYLELAFSQSFNVKKFGRIDVNLTSGKFMQQEFLHFNDFYHFPTGRTLKTSHPVISTFRLLPYYEFSTNNYFHRIHIQTQTANFLLSKWSFIKKSRVLENIFINLAITDKLQPFLEMGYALDNILKKFRLEIVSGRYDGKWLGPRIILGPTSL
jgi:hypothetical protein